VVFFFFSSRRRHTRFSRDWSSDVCSSDLTGRARVARHTSAEHERAPWRPLLLCGVAIAFASSAANFLGAYLASWAHDVGLTIGQIGRASCRERGMGLVGGGS